MKSLARAVYGLAALFLGGASTRAAVAVSSLRVTGTLPPYSIGYTLGQDATRLTITIRNAGTGDVVRTFNSIGINPEITAPDLKMGPHPNVVLWDGRMDNGQVAPGGAYYAQSLAYGNGTNALRLLSGPNPFTAAPGKSEARGLYGGDVNHNPNSPFKNLAYFAVTATNAGGSAGVEVVDADGNSALFSLPEKTATGAYDYVSASVLDDDSVLLDGQTWMRLTAVSPQNGTIQATYAAGRVNGRTMKAFGAGAAARVYYVGADEAGVYLLNPLTGTPVVIVPRSALPGNARGLEVRADESALYVSGDNGYVYKFNRPTSGVTWTRDTTFNMAAMTGEARGVALAPNGSILWVANNNTADSSKDRVFGVNATTGAALSANYQYVFGDALTPQGMAVSAGGNIFVQGWRSTATGSSANSIAVLAPPEGTTMDQTNSNTFTVPAVTGTVALGGGPSVTGITYQGATVSWQTSVPATSVLQVGLSPGVYTRTITQDAAPNLVTLHSVDVDGLAPGLTYYYRVQSTAPGYGAAASAPSTFVTGTLALSAVEVSGVTDSTAHVRWTTNAPATSVVRYGSDAGALTAVRGDDTLTTAHDVTLTGLTPGATWYAAPESGAGGAAVVSVVAPPQPFTTLNSGRVLTERLLAGADAVTLSWETNVPLSATVNYGSAPGALSSGASAATGTTGSVELPGLSPGATYFYRILFSGVGVASFSTPVAAFTTETAQAGAKVVTQDSVEDLATARRVNVDVGADAGLVSLQKQAVPASPVTTTPLPQPRYHHAVVAHNGTLYAIGGYDADGNASATVYHAPILPDGTVGAWATTTSLPAPRVGIADMAFGYSGRVYVVAGADASFNSLNTVLFAEQNADGTLGAWQETTPVPLPNGRDDASVTVANGRVYLTGGEDNAASPTTDRGVYSAAIHADGTLGQWDITGAAPDALRGGRTRANAGTVYAFGGYGADDIYNDRAETANDGPAGGLTPFLPDPDAMSTPRYGFAAALAGGKLITLAGRARPGGFTRAIEYAPLAEDGNPGPWTLSPEQTPDAVDALDGVSHGDGIYTVGGRRNYGTGPAANATADVTLATLTPTLLNGASYSYNGTLESAILDLGEVTNLRRLTVSATGAVQARYRFAGADGAFSAWLTPDAQTGDISGGARYVQYALTLSGDGTSTPAVNAVTITTGATAGTPLPGDVDRDGIVTRADAALALRIAGGLLPATDPSVSLQNADVDGDGHITALDAAAIAEVAATSTP